MSALERNPQVPGTNPHKVLSPGIDGRGIPRGPCATRMGMAFPEATGAGPLVPIVSREHLLQFEKIQEVLPFR